MTTGAAIVASGNTWVTDKVPYVWGGVSKLGADCSGFVQSVLAGLGVNVGRTVGEQATQGSPVALGSTDPLSNALPGDILIFGGNAHEGIYTGGGYMIDEAHSGTVAGKRKVWSGGSEPLTGIRRFSDGSSATQVNWLDDLGGTVGGAIGGAGGAVGGAVSGSVYDSVVKPFADLGGGLGSTLTRGTLVLFGFVMVLIALHALTSNAETPLGAGVEGGTALGRNVKTGIKRGAMVA